MEQVKLSIIIPVYNEEKTILETIRLVTAEAVGLVVPDLAIGPLGVLGGGGAGNQQPGSGKKGCP